MASLVANDASAIVVEVPASPSRVAAARSATSASADVVEVPASPSRVAAARSATAAPSVLADVHASSPRVPAARSATATPSGLAEDSISARVAGTTAEMFAATSAAHVALPARSASLVRIAGLAVLCAATLVAPALLLVWMPIVLGVPHIASDIRFLVLPLPRRQVVVSLAACAALVVLKAMSLSFGLPLLRLEMVVVAAWLLLMLALERSTPGSRALDRRSHVLARHAHIALSHAGEGDAHIPGSPALDRHAPIPTLPAVTRHAHIPGSPALDRHAHIPGSPALDRHAHIPTLPAVARHAHIPTLPAVARHAHRSLSHAAEHRGNIQVSAPSRRYAARSRSTAVWLLVGLAAFAIIALPIHFAILAAFAHNFVAVIAWIIVKRPTRRHTLAVIATLVAAVAVLILVGPAVATMTGGAASPWLTIDKAASVMFAGVPLPTARGLMIAFAFLQGVHYAIWLDWVPRGSPRMATKPWLLVLAGTLVVVAAALVNPAWARTTYLALATFHIYLELVVLAARAAKRYA